MRRPRELLRPSLDRLRLAGLIRHPQRAVLGGDDLALVTDAVIARHHHTVEEDLVEVLAIAVDEIGQWARGDAT